MSGIKPSQNARVQTVEADTTLDLAGTTKIGGVTLSATATQLNTLATQGGNATGRVVESAMVSLTETTGAGTYTATVNVPAGALILDIKAWSTALWTATTSAALDIGDATDPNGWFAGIDLKATDLLVGEEINFENTGGKEGAYLVPATGARSAAYSASARVISFVAVTVGAAGNAGRTFGAVLWTVPTATAATKA